MANSTTPKPRRKPDNPRPDFPVYAHASGKWSKTIRAVPITLVVGTIPRRHWKSI